MNAARAKRRWVRWARYTARTNSMPANKRTPGFHRGEAQAYNDAVYAGRAAPRGIRNVWFPKWSVRW